MKGFPLPNHRQRKLRAKGKAVRRICEIKEPATPLQSDLDPIKKKREGGGVGVRGTTSKRIAVARKHPWSKTRATFSQSRGWERRKKSRKLHQPQPGGGRFWRRTGGPSTKNSEEQVKRGRLSGQAIEKKQPGKEKTQNSKNNVQREGSSTRTHLTKTATSAPKRKSGRKEP